MGLFPVNNIYVSYITHSSPCPLHSNAPFEHRQVRDRESLTADADAKSSVLVEYMRRLVLEREVGVEQAALLVAAENAQGEAGAEPVPQRGCGDSPPGGSGAVAAPSAISTSAGGLCQRLGGIPPHVHVFNTLFVASFFTHEESHRCCGVCLHVCLRPFSFSFFSSF
jgi:hypothetical protein